MIFQTEARPRKFRPTTRAEWLDLFPHRAGLFGRPALSRYERIRRRSAATWSNAERCYLELADLLDTYPKAFPTALHQLVTDANGVPA